MTADVKSSRARHQNDSDQLRHRVMPHHTVDSGQQQSKFNHFEIAAGIFSEIAIKEQIETCADKLSCLSEQMLGLHKSSVRLYGRHCGAITRI